MDGTNLLALFARVYPKSPGADEGRIIFAILSFGVACSNVQPEGLKYMLGQKRREEVEHTYLNAFFEVERCILFWYINWKKTKQHEKERHGSMKKIFFLNKEKFRLFVLNESTYFFMKNINTCEISR